MCRLSVLACCSVLAFSIFARADSESDDQALDEQILKAVQSGVDGPALLDFFKKRTITDVERKHVDELIKQLGDEEFATREKAKEALLDLGPVAIKQLDEARKSSDLEVVQRAQECLQVLTRAADPSVSAAAVRLIAKKNPPGTAAALLAYLPFTSDEAVIDDIRTALAAVAVREGKPEKALLDAVDDKLPLRRAAAAEALVRSGPEDVRADLKKLLKDKDNTIRLWTAQGFLDRRDADAVPVLIELLGAVDDGQAYGIEDSLARVAGDKAPNVGLGKDAAGRKKCREAWEKWWTDDGSKLDLTKIELGSRMLGYTLLIGTENNKGVKGIGGRVSEIGLDGSVRWEIKGLMYPIDAHVLGHDRVLIVEYSGRAVTERNTQGDVLWRKDLNPPMLPLSARRLPNGNTFIACRNALLEVDKEGKEVFNIPRANSDVLGADKLPNGQIVITTASNNGLVEFIDKEGKELKSVNTGMQPIFGGGIDVLPNGHVLVPLLNQQKVVEVDAEGTVKWSAGGLQQPTHVTRLPNGHTLVCNLFSEVIELDQDGKEIWKQKTDGLRLLKARRR